MVFIGGIDDRVYKPSIWVKNDHFLVVFRSMHPGKTFKNTVKPLSNLNYTLADGFHWWQSLKTSNLGQNDHFSVVFGSVHPGKTPKITLVPKCTLNYS